MPIMFFNSSKIDVCCTPQNIEQLNVPLLMVNGGVRSMDCHSGSDGAVYLWHDDFIGQLMPEHFVISTILFLFF